MSQREDFTEQSPLFRNTPRGRLSAAQTALGGRGAHCKRATAPGRTRLDALVTLAGYQLRRREIWRNPSSLGEGVAPQKWCATKRSRNADALPYGKRAHAK